MDHYRLNDIESTLTVLWINDLIGLFTPMFVIGTRYELFGLIGLDTIFYSTTVCFHNRYL